MKSRILLTLSLLTLATFAPLAVSGQARQTKQQGPAKTPIVTSDQKPIRQIRGPVLQGMAPQGRVVNARAPIPFQEFKRVDPKTKQPVAPTAMITLSNGRQVQAGKYYDSLNKVEQQLNAIGMTLRGKENVLVEIRPTTSPSLVKNQIASIKSIAPKPFKKGQFEVSLKEMSALEKRDAELRKQKLDAALAKGKNKADSVSGQNQSDPDFNSKKNGTGPAPSAALAAYSQPGAAQFSGTDEPEGIVLGDPAFASFKLNTKLLKDMSPLSASFGVEGRLGVTLLSQQIDPAVVTARFNAPLVGAKGFNLTLKPPNSPAIPYNKPSAGLEINDRQGADLNGEVKATIVLGIIPVTFAAGIRGQVGIEYGVGFVAGGTTADNKPIDGAWYSKSTQQQIEKSTFKVGLHGHADVFLNATVYASAVVGGSIDLGLCTVGASLGAETDMTLFDGRIVFAVDGLIEKPANDKPHGKLTYSGDYVQAHAMEGDLFIEAKLDFCIKSVTYRYYIWSNPGVAPVNRNLFKSPPGGETF